ncbi:MAG TPA: PTS sugar transporter subunit IIA [Planctomycetota bacterium]|nr:PTS sugar transporter subunit IIA [Planctomycetota bacterium]
MDLRQLFQKEDLILGFDPRDKWDAIRRLVTHLVTSGRFNSATGDRIYEQVLARERSMSTGMERGIAIPHAAVDEVSKVTACMGIVQRPGGLPFESIDGQPAQLVVLLVIPRAHKLLHIRTLADVARVLSNDKVREMLVGATDQLQAWEALGAAEPQR